MNSTHTAHDDVVRTLDEGRKFLWQRHVKENIRMVNALLKEQIPELPVLHTLGLIGRA